MCISHIWALLAAAQRSGESVTAGTSFHLGRASSSHKALGRQGPGECDPSVVPLASLPLSASPALRDLGRAVPSARRDVPSVTDWLGLVWWDWVEGVAQGRTAEPESQSIWATGELRSGQGTHVFFRPCFPRPTLCPTSPEPQAIVFLFCFLLPLKIKAFFQILNVVENRSRFSHSVLL